MSDALAAALLMSQRRRTDPNDATRKYGQYLLQQGSSVAPVQSPMEGLARALQGGVGGLVEGMADQSQRDTDTRTQQNLASILGANTPEEMQAAIKGFGNKPGDMEIMGPVMAQMISQKQDQMRAGTAAGQFGVANGQPAVSGTPQVAGSTVPPPDLPGGAVPAGAFANNTGNIRATPGVSFPGQGAPQNGFMTFDSPQSGVNAQFKNLASYAQQNPGMTVAQAISKWAPPSENDTQGYIRQVAETTGINPGMPLGDVLKDPAVGAQLLDAMTRKEKGGLPQGVTADTFMAATGGQPQVAQGPQIAQGDSVPQGPVTQVGDSATSGPPQIARPQPSPEQIKRYQTLISTGKVSVEQAQTGLKQELDKQWDVDRQIALETWKDQQSSKRQNEKAAIDLTQKAPMEAIGKLTDNYFTKTRPAAEAASSAIANLHQTRQLLDAGAFTGTGAEAKLALSKVAETLGFDPSTATANTQALQAGLAKQVIAGMGGSLGTGVSNADRDFMEKANAGQITWTDESLRKLLDVNERVARRTLTNHDAEAKRVKTLPGMSNLGDDQYAISPAPTYEEWKKATGPLPGPAAPPPPAAAVPPPDGQYEYRRNPDTGAIQRRALK